MIDDFSPEDISDAMDHVENQATIQAITGLDSTPDQGVRALQIATATGAPPTLVHDDLEGFEKDHRASLTTQIIRNNPSLISYIQENPLADVVSSDDWGTLDEVVRSVPTLGTIDNAIEKYVTNPLIGGIMGAGQGAYEGAMTGPTEEDVRDFERTGPIGKYSYGVKDIGRRIFNAFMGSMTGAVEGAVHPLAEAISPGSGDKAVQETLGIMESEMGRMGEHHAAEWMKSGIEPPRGVHPELDAAKAKVNAEIVGSIEVNLRAAQESATKERAQEHFANLLKGEYGDATISISGDRVSELYGDGRVPAPDDGLLGWVPDLESKLETARETGDDVHIPIADMISKIDPAVFRELKDDLRVWPGGITAREAGEEVIPKVTVDSPLAQVRGTLGTEPMFAIGDRKLELKRLPEIEDGYFHEYQFLDQNGKPVGNITLVPDEAKKQLYVVYIGGQAGLYSNSFGPSLVRDLKKQIKALYPEFETITGHRVSGARYTEEMIVAKAKRIAEERGVVWDELSEHTKGNLISEASDRLDNPTDHPVVKLAVDEHINEFRELLSDRATEDLGWGVKSELLRPEDLTPEQYSFIQVAEEELNRITGGRSSLHIRGGISAEQLPGAPIRGVSFGGKVFLDIFGPDRIGVLRHEAGHELRKWGLIRDNEWGMLKDTADAEGWLDKFQIHERYPQLDGTKKYEEAIVEALRDYGANKYEPPAGIKKIFDKIIDLWNKIVERWTGETGYTAEQLFDRILSGEIGKREERIAAERIDPQFSVEDANEKMDNLRAAAAGLDQKSFKKLQAQLQARHKEDYAAALARAEKNQKKIQSAEWKKESAELAKEVEKTIRQRPDVMADLLIGRGEFLGKELDKRAYPIRASDLTDEQKAGLPRRYYSNDGIPVDSLANMLGYPSGDLMVEDLAKYNADRGNLTAKEHFEAVVKAETQRQMEAKLGKLDDNIMAEAVDQALSETNLNLIAEEWQGAAMQAGISVIDKDTAKAMAMDMFAKRQLKDLSFDRMVNLIARHGREAERFLIAGDPARAVVAMQRKYMASLLAAETKKLEKVQRAFDRTAKQFGKREVASADPEYMVHIHDILGRVGKPVKPSLQDIEKRRESYGGKGLEEFVAEKTAALREVPVWDQLYDASWKRNFEDLTVEEFRAVSDSLKTLVFHARDEMKIYRQGEAEDFAAVKAGLIEGIANAVNRKIREPRKSSVIKTYFVKHLQMENIFNRWDAFDPKGLWNQYVMRDLVDGANQVDAWKKEYAGKIKALGTPEGLERTVDSIFKDQDTGTTIPLTRKNLIAVMLNTGTGTGAKSNLGKLAKGYGLTPEEVMTWVNAHATKADWEFVTGVWDIFADIKSKADTMYRSLTGGVAPEDVPTYPIQTPHGVVKGGYYPIIFDAAQEGKSKKLMGKDPLEQDGFVRATTPAGYTKSRTGYAAPLALDLDQMPGRMAQMLHDIGLRPAVLNAAKVFYDHDVRSAVRKHFGNEYRDELIPYLQGIANASNRMDRTQQAMARVSEFVRQNVITTLVGLNPGTVLKHGPSALVTSIREVGPTEFAKAVRGLFTVNENTGETNWQFAIKHSLELQRRDRNWEETLYGATGGLTPGEKFEPWRQRIMQWSSKPVAMSDMLSAVPTWLAAYEKEMKATGVHGDAVYMADRAVRRAHGSTAPTSRTGIVRDSNPWLTSVYNFFSDIMNRQMEAIWRAGEITDIAKGDKAKAMKEVGVFTGSLFAYAIWPAVVEHLVSGEPEDPKESWGTMAAKSMARTAASSWVGVRDIANYLLYGFDPQFGLAGTALKELTAAAKDLKKDHPFAKQQAGKLLQDSVTMVGAMTGMLPAQVGRTGRFLMDVKSGEERPKGPWGWVTGLRFGTTEHHSKTFQDFVRGKR